MGEQMPDDERRRDGRVDTSFPAKMDLIFPECTFTPVGVVVMVRDASEIGLRVTIPPFPEPFNRFQLRRGLFARVQIRDGQSPARLYCQVVWIRPKIDDAGREYHEVGLSYNLREPSDRQDATRILGRARFMAPRPAGEGLDAAAFT